VSSDDVWAVGYYFYSAGLVYQTLIEHWDGAAWSIVPSPNGQSTNFLLGVSAIASDDAWAVGYYREGGSLWRTLIEHWDGTSWSIVPSPNANSEDNSLWAVAAASADDAWAVGHYTESPETRPLIEHWDGTQWSVVNSPIAGSTQNYLQGVTIVNANDAWAVGYDYVPGQWRVLTQHWDGIQWSVVPGVSVDPYENGLLGVSAIAADDVWAVGYFSDSADGFKLKNLVEHWDGTQWSLSSSPSVGSGDNYFAGVSALSSSDVWAVGYYMNGTVQRTLVEHWSGGWNVVPSANNGANSNQLAGVSALSGDDVWAAGDALINSSYRTMTQHYTHTCVTPTPTPPPCVLQFEDVHSTDWYYTYVEWMYCHSVITGYTGPPQCSGPGATCFKPNNSTTRGQMAKIVVLAYFFPIDTTGGPHFTDVPQGSTFYDYVETARNLELVDGYPDGTFRPNNEVTRGQLSKIVVNAAILADPGHWSLQNPVDATFEDVPVGSTFFRHVETAAMHNVVNGYPCGIPPAGACETGNKPYFLPGAHATRAQISKIVYLALPVGPGRLPAKSAVK
jgi:hypothetical protein